MFMTGEVGTLEMGISILFSTKTGGGGELSHREGKCRLSALFLPLTEVKAISIFIWCGSSLLEKEDMKAICWMSLKL